MISPILLNDFQRKWQEIRTDTLNAIDRVGQSGWLILHDEVKRLEQQLAKLCQQQYAITCATGLDALEIALRCLNIQPGDKVLTTPLTFFATTLAVLKTGAIPLFVDVDHSGLLDLELCESVLQQETDIKFLLPVHLYGHAIDSKKLQTLKTRFNLKIVEDCAQAVGATSHQQAVGTLGDISATSFYPTKNLACLGDGGAILTSNAT